MQWLALPLHTCSVALAAQARNEDRQAGATERRCKDVETGDACKMGGIAGVPAHWGSAAAVLQRRSSRVLPPQEIKEAYGQSRSVA